MHAAGHKVFDFVIPTPSILALSSKFPESSNDPRLLAGRQPHSDDLRKLPGVVAELEHIKTAIRNSPSTRVTLVESSLGTVEEVFSLVKGAD